METKNTSLTAEHSLLYLASHDLEHAKQMALSCHLLSTTLLMTQRPLSETPKGLLQLKIGAGLLARHCEATQ